ncbi:beta-N-acetylhexosaminidase [Aureibaculum conchae]|uniref:beta-N-acetylhexosaminidase n=1 Tax=Aureibaculum sp. 2308TA14-22 TaxID=3108392 RepID=UPI00339AE404
MNKHLFLLIFTWLFTIYVQAQQSVRIIPQPNKVEEKQGQLQLKNTLTIVTTHTELFQLTNYAVNMFEDDFKLQTHVQSESTGNQVVRFKLDKNKNAQDAYKLNVGKQGIDIISATEQGLFYGLQTLRQLISSDGKVQYVKIDDTPRFGWRAFMLDEGRYFQGKAQVLKLLDEMARLKMNVFHWHLVDDQGWRIEIKKYPKLTQVGSKRPSTQVGPLKWNSPIQSGESHAGFYTQEDIKEIVKYAQKRHITIVPEIEMPGHSSAAIAAYPWLGTSGKDIDVPIWFGVSKDVYNVADPRVYNFLTDVLDEVITLFPSKVIHIGGDEAKYDHWQKSDFVKNYMKENNLKTFADLQVVFTNRISNYLESKGRRMMGWNEILGHNVHDYQSDKDTGAEKELSKSSVIHFWRGDIKLMTSAAENGYDIVNSLHSETYLDYDYKNIPLKKAYNFNPIPQGLDQKYHNRIKGLGCQMWGEWIPKSGYMDFMTFPRIAAYAEVGWTQEDNKDYEAFKLALQPILKEWEQKSIFYAPMEFAEPGFGKWVKPN